MDGSDPVEERLAAIERRLGDIEGLLRELTAANGAAPAPKRARGERKLGAREGRRGKKGTPRATAGTAVATPLSASDADFAGNIDDPNVGVAADFTADSTTMLLAFGGMRLQMGIPPFEFFTLTRELPVKRLYVRDARQSWYHRGVPGYGDGIDDFAARLRELIGEQDIERLVVAGNSAGGYAALLFGTMLEADVVLSFSPQTFLIPEELHAIGDHRWDGKLKRLDAAGGPDERYIDLGAVLPGMANGKTQYQVHYAASLELDDHHAKRVAGMPQLRLHAYPEGGHTVIRLLKRTGDLSTLLSNALAGE